jgi:hypothetical protein
VVIPANTTRSFESRARHWRGRVYICLGGRVIEPLPMHLDLINHSPTGFAWGYNGSGPAQLAFAILAAVIGPEAASERTLYQRYKFDVIARLPRNESFVITEDEVKTWLAQQLGKVHIMSDREKRVITVQFQVDRDLDADNFHEFLCQYIHEGITIPDTECYKVNDIYLAHWEDVNKPSDESILPFPVTITEEERS